jgi:hypothetical protein
MQQVKAEWTNDDFTAMSWHDSRIYSMSFPNEKLEFSIDIDYIFKWEKVEAQNRFWVSPCHIKFEDVLNLKINVDFQNSVGIDILSIKRENDRLSPNGRMIIWDFEIETDKGTISFQSTGYVQIVLSQPILSISQDLNR